jgi:2OG-Fe(II) oxygenase superfamily
VSALRSSTSLALDRITTSELSSLRQNFERNHWFRLQRLVGEELLHRISGEIDNEEFQTQTHDTAHTELVMRTGRAANLLAFLTNDPRLFQLIREITGCDPISWYAGRIYRMLPGPEHEGHWHDDALEGRMLAMTLNLGEAPYSGGVLEIREASSKKVVDKVENTGPGDALVFRVDPSLEHRVGAVEGDVPKTAFAGWFLSAQAPEPVPPVFQLTGAAGDG